MNLDLNEDCKYLTYIEHNEIVKSYLPSLPDDTMIVLMICGTQLKLKAFDYMPEMILNLGAVPDHISYEREVYLYPYNGYH